MLCLNSWLFFALLICTFMPGFSSKLYWVVMTLSTNTTRLVNSDFTLLRLMPDIFFMMKSINSAGSVTFRMVYWAAFLANGRPVVFLLPLDIINYLFSNNTTFSTW